MQASLIPSNTTTSDRKVDKVDIKKIKSRFSTSPLSDDYQLIAGATSSANSAGFAWVSAQPIVDIDDLDPKGDALDALVAQFPAPKVWYEEDWDD